LVGKDTLSAAAYDRIRSAILNGEYRLGTPLSRRRLAAELGMSLIPVAEALQQLEREGLVESRPRVGTRVKIPTADEIRGYSQVREALETQAARLFAELAGAKERSELMKMAERLDALNEKLAKTGDKYRFASWRYEQEHMRLHLKIAECSKCKELIDAIERSRVLIFNWLFNVTVRYEPLPTRWHVDLIEVLNQGDPVKADEAMRRHVGYRRDDVIQRFNVLLAADESKSQIVRGPQRRTREKQGLAAR
jgi:DNA-binding GntR family transcriptional regulator